MCCLGFGFPCGGSELQKVFIYISINRFLHNKGPGESRDVCGGSSAWYNSPDQISKLAPHWSWVHIINVNELVQWQISWIMNLYRHQLYSCIRASVMHPCHCDRSLTFFFFFTSTPTGAPWEQRRRFCHVQAHVFYSVLGFHTGPHLIEHTFIVSTCAHFGVMCAVALLLMCIQIVLISVSWFSAGPGPKKVQVPLISADKACSLDCGLFFFLCIINQYSHNKPLTHKKNVLSCLTDDLEYFAPLIKPSLYWIYTFLPIDQT